MTSLLNSKLIYSMFLLKSLLGYVITSISTCPYLTSDSTFRLYLFCEQPFTVLSDSHSVLLSTLKILENLFKLQNTSGIYPFLQHLKAIILSIFLNHFFSPGLLDQAINIPTGSPASAFICYCSQHRCQNYLFKMLFHITQNPVGNLHFTQSKSQYLQRVLQGFI